MDSILQEFATIVSLVTPLALTFGLSQWVIRFILSAMLGDYKRKMDILRR